MHKISSSTSRQPTMARTLAWLACVYLVLISHLECTCSSSATTIASSTIGGPASNSPVLELHRGLESPPQPAQQCIQPVLHPHQCLRQLSQSALQSLHAQSSIRIRWQPTSPQLSTRSLPQSRSKMQSGRASIQRKLGAFPPPVHSHR